MNNLIQQFTFPELTGEKWPSLVYTSLPQWQFYYIHLCIKGKKNIFFTVWKKLSKSYGKALLLWYIISACRVSLPFAKATPPHPCHIHTHTQMHTYTSIHKYTNTLVKLRNSKTFWGNSTGCIMIHFYWFFMIMLINWKQHSFKVFQISQKDV